MPTDPMFIAQLDYAVRATSAFVGISFAPEDKEVNGVFIELLSKLGVKASSAEQPEPQAISSKVAQRINEAELFVGIFTRRDKNSNGTYSVSPWVVQEFGAALAAGKQLLLFVEEGTEKNIGGLQADFEYIPFNRNKLAPALLKTIDYVLKLVRVPITYQRDPSNPSRVNISIGPANAPLNDRIKRLQARKQQQAQDLGTRLELADAFAQNNQLDAAIAEYLDLLRVSPDNAGAYHRLGHLYERVGRLNEAIQNFQSALDRNPADHKNYECFGKCLYRRSRTSTEKAAKRDDLERAKRLLERAVAVGGEKVRAELAGDLFLVEEAMKDACT